MELALGSTRDRQETACSSSARLAIAHLRLWSASLGETLAIRHAPGSREVGRPGTLDVARGHPGSSDSASPPSAPGTRPALLQPGLPQAPPETPRWSRTPPDPPLLPGTGADGHRPRLPGFPETACASPPASLAPGRALRRSSDSW